MSVQVLEIISLPLSLFQLFLTWTCSVICFTHSTEMAQLRGEWLVGEGKGESGAADVGSAARSARETIASASASQAWIKWSLTLL